MQIEHAYDRLVPVAIFEANGTELSPSWRAGVTISDNARASIESLVQFSAPLDRVDPHRPSDVPEVLLGEIGEGGVDTPANMVVGGA